jgi:hypothetical protein
VKDNSDEGGHLRRLVATWLSGVSTIGTKKRPDVRVARQTAKSFLSVVLTQDIGEMEAAAAP